MRVVRLEEERLTGLQRAERMPATGTPEIDFRHLRPGGEEAVPAAVSHPDVRAHADSVLRCARQRT